MADENKRIPAILVGILVAVLITCGISGFALFHQINGYTHRIHELQNELNVSGRKLEEISGLKNGLEVENAKLQVSLDTGIEGLISQRYSEKLENLKNDAEKRLDDAAMEKKKEINSIVMENDQRISSIVLEYKNEIDAVVQEKDKRINTLVAENGDLKASVASLNMLVISKDDLLKSIRIEVQPYSEIIEEKVLLGKNYASSVGLQYQLFLQNIPVLAPVTIIKEKKTYRESEFNEATRLVIRPAAEGFVTAFVGSGGSVLRNIIQVIN